jgi:hypothetical protein
MREIDTAMFSARGRAVLVSLCKAEDTNMPKH